jgi:sterol desaturase/sphingolipid hydroxylase (fatty acid hydroxylase superfamily)
VIGLFHLFVDHLLATLPWLLGLGVVFAIMSRFMPCNPQLNYWKRSNVLTDVWYWLVIPLASRYVKITFLVAGASVVLGITHDAELDHYFSHGYGIFSTLPLWLQAILILVLSDIPLYFIHRGFHGKTFWKYHAVHHSTKELDWMATQRFHPINTWLAFTLVDAVMVLLGFAPEAFVLIAPFNVAFSAYVHANLNWTLGPFKYVIASPVFHRWHHTVAKEGGNKNFAPTFPILDILCGTFYMPRGKLPENYGIDDTSFPDRFIGQLLYPFRAR